MKKLAPFIGITIYSIMLFAFTLSSCHVTTEEEKRAEREKVYFLDEKFIIISTSGGEIAHQANGNHIPTNEKNWLVQRVKEVYPDTLEFAELHNTPQIGTFAINNELWYSKQIGDTLFFEYILKERFFKVAKKDTKPTTPAPVKVETVQDYNLENSFEIERKILDLEREMGDLEREIESLRNKLKN